MRKTASGGGLLRSLLPIALLRHCSVGSSMAAMRRSLDVRTGSMSQIDGIEDGDGVGMLATPLFPNQRRLRPSSLGFDTRDMSGDRKQNHQRVSAWRDSKCSSGGCNTPNLLAMSQPQVHVQGPAGSSADSSDRQVRAAHPSIHPCVRTWLHHLMIMVSA